MRVIKNKKTVALIKAHLENNGTKHSWLCNNIGISSGHLTNILSCKRNLTPEIIDKINEVLGTSFKLQSL